MINYLTCFKCWGGKAVLTYEENRIYKVSCECGCSYTFEHSSMKAANEYHNKMLELYGEIDKNSKLQTEIAELKAERDAAIEDLKRALFHLEPMQCWYCEHDGTECRSEYMCVKPKAGTGVPSGWQWRGLEGGERNA